MLKQCRNLCLLAASCLFIVACDSGSSSPAVSTGITTEQPQPPADPTIVAGIAAVGAALDGALIEVIDASGNLVDIPDTATGTDGSYSVVLPPGIALPVIIRATPPGGTPLLNIVQAPADGSTDIVANINPITNLVSSSVLGGADATSNAGLASALATVDPSTIDDSGDAIINRVFGANLDYDAFSTDPDFVANDGTASGSAADSVLDTIARRAADAGTTVDEALALFAEAPEPPALLEDPTFQVELVSEIVKGGADTTQLESQLTDIGALQSAPTDGSADVFRTIIAVVPAVIETTRTNTSGVSDNADLVNVAIDATVKVISNTIAKKTSRFNASPADVVGLLSSPGFQSTTTAVVASAVTPILQSVNDTGNVGDLLTTVSSVAKSIAEEASEVVSGFEYNENTPDISNLVTTFVATKVTGGQTITADTLQAINNGTVSPSDVVIDSGDVSDLQGEIQDFASQNPDLVTGDIADALQEIPVGNWDQSNWDSFNWG